MRVVKKPEERKAEMVAAAAKLFAQQGFVRTSVSEIVSAVDVAKGLFYYYFTTKDDMVKAVVEGYCSYLGTLAGQIADGEGTAREKFAKLMHPEVWHECFTAPLEGMRHIAATRPDIVFLDIEMNSSNGLALAHELPEDTCLIFTTAYSQYAVSYTHLTLPTNSLV